MIASTPALYSDALRIPSGWYCLGAAADVPRRTPTTRHLAGRDLVLFRTEGGAVAALDAHCPHLGAHMGRGRVEGESLRCPFHGFCFDGAGACTATPYGKPPPAARARAYPVRVLHGVVLAYFHPDGAAPTWQPADVDMTGWAPFRLRAWNLRGHPQETSENSVDVGHFGVVHGYRDVRDLAPLATDGPHLRARYAFARPIVGALAAREEIEVHLWGLGYSRVDVTDRVAGLDLRLLVMATPRDAERIELRIGLSVRDFRASPRVPRWARRAPRLLTGGLLGRGLLGLYARDVSHDFGIWEGKRYVERPPLAVGDGPIGAYRRWARQFYS